MPLLQAELIDIATRTDFTIVGIMAVLIIALSFAVIKLWLNNNTLSKERMEDLKEIINSSNENNVKFLIILEQIKERLK